MNQGEINTNAAAEAAASATALVFTTAFAVVTAVAAAEAAAPAAAFVLISSWFMIVSGWFLTGLLTGGKDHYAQGITESTCPMGLLQFAGDETFFEDACAAAAKRSSASCGKNEI